MAINKDKIKPLDKASEFKPTQEGDLTYKQFKLAVWYVGHKILLQKIGLGILIGWCVITIGFSLIMWGAYLFSGYWQDQKMANEQVLQAADYAAIHSETGAKNIEILFTQIMNSAGDKYDFVSEVYNPNERWLAEVKFLFTYSNGQTELNSAYILPQRKGILAVLGNKSASSPGSANLQIENVVWKKINPHQVPDVKNYIDERLNFQLNDLQFVLAGKDTPVNAVKFLIKNSSAYNYWQPLFFVKLFDGQDFSGLINLSLDQFKSGEERPVEYRIFNGAYYVTDLELIPMINIFDRNAFMAPES